MKAESGGVQVADRARRMDANGSLWSATSAPPAFGRLESDLGVEIAIAGGGITGLTAALELAEQGKRVAVLEAHRVGSGVTMRSTAHATEIVDAGYVTIEARFGREGARLVAASSRAAIENMAELAERVGAPFRRRCGYLYAEREARLGTLREEHDAALRAGLTVRLKPEAPLPFATKGALEIEDQAQFHVGRYVAGLAAEARARGVLVFEDTRVVAVEDGEPCLVHVEGGPIVRAGTVLLATHAPIERGLVQAKVAAYRSYVLAFDGVSLPDGMFWDTEDPYHYLSAFDVDGVPWLLVGGEDHKTGSRTDTEARFDALLEWTRARVSVEEPRFRWSAQVEVPLDGLPYIGRSSLGENILVATGFAGNGTTFGTLAAMIASDLVLHRPNPWAELYAATRMKPLASAGAFVGENIDFPIHLVTDRLAPPDARTLADIAPGQGKTVKVGGQRLAVYRDPEGNVHALSPVCTHLGCFVKFNAAEKTWDCPCHGSRFGIDGAVLDGPATRALAKRTIGGAPRHASGTVVLGPDAKRSREGQGR